MTSHSFASRSGARLIGWVAATALMLGAIALAPVIGEPATMALVAAGAVLALTLCVYWFVRLDELAQRAHYVAWFWGGSLGFAVVGVLLLIALLIGIADMRSLHGLAVSLFGGAAFEDGIATGMLLVAAPMFVGYAAWWTVFWMRRR